MDIFFQTLAKTDSEEEAFEALRRYLVKKKLEMADVLNLQTGTDSLAEFEEVWELVQRERALRKIIKKT